MTDRAQFEAMLEALINEDQETAKEIFHNIVVAKSREIYEELLAEGFEEEEEEEEGEEEEESGDDSDVGGDATDDFVSDVSDDDGEESDDFGGEEGEGELEDRVLDLEDALEELKAEFDSLMADEANEPEHNDGVDDPDFGDEEEPAFGDEEGSEDEFGGELGDDDQEVKEIHHYHHDGDKMPQDEFEAFMEYVNKVALPKHGDNGVNTKSIVAGKNDMGGTAANIAKSFSTETGGTASGLLKPSTQLQDAGNQNKPGADVGKSAFKKQQPGHGAEKKGKGESAPNPKSIIGSRK